MLFKTSKSVILGENPAVLLDVSGERFQVLGTKVERNKIICLLTGFFQNTLHFHSFCHMLLF